MRNVILQLHITGNCNLRCKHCYIDEHCQDMSLNDVRKALNQFDALVQYLRKNGNPDLIANVHFTGGEPLLHPQINRILLILLVRRYKYRYGIMTNATVLKPTTLALLRMIKPKAVQISVDGDEQTHDYIRGEGNYSRVLLAIKKLKRWGLRVRISFTANKNNYTQFSNVAKMCRENGVSSLWSDRYVPIDKSSEILPLDKDDMKKYVAMLKREAEHPKNKKSGIRIENFRALQFIGTQLPPYKCIAGESLVVVDEKGNIMPCRRMPIVCGNINNTTLLEVYCDNDIFNDLRQHNCTERCAECEYKEKCAGGSRCISYAINGNYTLTDPCCFV